MTEFKDLSVEDKKKVIAFIEESIQKHYKEHQIYDVQIKLTLEDPGIDLEEADEFCEPDIIDVWYECTQCEESPRMDKLQAINHAMEYLGLRKGVDNGTDQN